MHCPHASTPIDFTRGSAHNQSTAILATEGVHKHGVDRHECGKCSESSSKHHACDVEDSGRSSWVLDGSCQKLGTQEQAQELEVRGEVSAVRSQRSRSVQEDDVSVAKRRPQRRCSRRLPSRRLKCPFSISPKKNTFACFHYRQRV